METYIKDWTAKRAGGRITITGVLDGKPVKVVGVDTIVAGKPFPIATDKEGKTYLLGSGAPS